MAKSKLTPRRQAVVDARAETQRRRPDILSALAPELLSLESLADQLDYWQYEAEEPTHRLTGYTTLVREYEVSLREIRRAWSAMPKSDVDATDWKAEALKYESDQ